MVSNFVPNGLMALGIATVSLGGVMLSEAVSDPTIS